MVNCWNFYLEQSCGGSASSLHEVDDLMQLSYRYSPVFLHLGAQKCQVFIFTGFSAVTSEQRLDYRTLYNTGFPVSLWFCFSSFLGFFKVVALTVVSCWWQISRIWTFKVKCGVLSHFSNYIEGSLGFFLLHAWCSWEVRSLMSCMFFKIRFVSLNYDCLKSGYLVQDYDFVNIWALCCASSLLLKGERPAPPPVCLLGSLFLFP